MSDIVVEATDLAKTYRAGSSIVRAVAGVSISIGRGEFVAIVGRSGSGKSSLMSLLGLLERPDSGRYVLSGNNAGALSEDMRAAMRGRHIGFVFQLPALLLQPQVQTLLTQIALLGQKLVGAHFL